MVLFDSFRPLTTTIQSILPYLLRRNYHTLYSRQLQSDMIHTKLECILVDVMLPRQIKSSDEVSVTPLFEWQWCHRAGIWQQPTSTAAAAPSSSLKESWAGEGLGNIARANCTYLNDGVTPWLFKVAGGSSVESTTHRGVSDPGNKRWHQSM
jgi:hypothetical protein